MVMYLYSTILIAYVPCVGEPVEDANFRIGRAPLPDRWRCLCIVMVKGARDIMSFLVIVVRGVHTNSLYPCFCHGNWHSLHFSDQQFHNCAQGCPCWPRFSCLRCSRYNSVYLFLVLLFLLSYSDSEMFFLYSLPL